MLKERLAQIYAGALYHGRSRPSGIERAQPITAEAHLDATAA
jgi:hypothetical protein